MTKFAAFLFVWIVASLIFAAILTGGYDNEAVTRACELRGGVQQVESVSFDVFENGDSALVVCKDGTVRGIK